VQENHYDPWGCNLVGIEVEGNPEHKWQFIDREKLEELGLNWYDLKARGYESVLGRFHSVDPLPDVEGQESLSPYHYGRNNPILLSDPNGNCDGCPPGSGMSVVENLYWDMRDRVTSGIVTAGTYAGSLFSNNIKVQRIQYTYNENGRNGKLAPIEGNKHVAAAIGLLDIASAIPGTGPANSLLAKIVGGKAAASEIIEQIVTLEANAIRFSQSSINAERLVEIETSMAKHGWQGDAVDVVKMSDGKLTALDNKEY